MKLKSLLLIGAACLALASCTTKESAMEDFRALKTEVTGDTKNWNAEEWRKFIVNFEKTDSILNTFDLTDEEKKEITKIKNQCALQILKGKAVVAADEVKDAAKKAVNEASDAVQGLIDDLTK